MTEQDGMQQTYQLELEITSPDIVTVDEQYEIIYKISNYGDGGFPGGRILCRLKWSSIGDDTFINHPLAVKPLLSGKSQEFPFSQIDRTPGITYITFIQAKETSEDNFHFIIFDAKKGNIISSNQTIQSLRVRSMEEVLQKEMIKALERNIDSQKRLERTQNSLALIGVAIALLQLAGMFIIPYLQSSG